MNDASPWQEDNRAALVAALDAVYAALAEKAPPAPVDPPATARALTALFSLSPFERDTLLLCAGMELDTRFPAACATAGSDPARAFPSFALALGALAGAHWSAIGSEAPLRYWRLVELETGGEPVRARLRLDPRILEALLGLDGTEPRLAGILRRDASPPPPAFLMPAVEAAAQAMQDQRAAGLAVRVLLAGGSAADRRSVAAEAMRRAGLGLQRINAADLPASATERAPIARLCNREARLTACGLLLECDGPGADAAPLFVRFAADLDGPVIIGDGEAPGAIRISLPAPDSAARGRAWRDALGAAGARLNGALESVAAHFTAEPASIEAVRLALARQPADADQAALRRAAWTACREQARGGLDLLATRIEPRAAWNDLVLPDAQKETLRQIGTQLRQRARVHDSWGFARKYSRGLGLTALFAGTSGVGKTMAAEVIAGSLDLDLFQIDLAATVSKYIGETEKNLKRIFDAAERSGAILLFDEADALFGKRSEVKDSHDRYANLEISYLLQRMEAYRGLAILTTNMRHALDPAFMRRLRFIVEFPFPDKAQRERIWQRVFPAGTPTEGIDHAALARLNVAGGTIRNIALHAAHLAADEGTAVRMTHLLSAARIEYAKLERPLTASETGGWA